MSQGCQRKDHCLFHDCSLPSAMGPRILLKRKRSVRMILLNWRFMSQACCLKRPFWNPQENGTGGVGAEFSSQPPWAISTLCKLFPEFLLVFWLHKTQVLPWKIKFEFTPQQRTLASFKTMYVCLPSSHCWASEPALPPPGWQGCNFQRRCWLKSQICIISSQKLGRESVAALLQKSRCFREVSGKYCFDVLAEVAHPM